MWPGDALIWGEVSPILFPVVGWLREGIRVEGRSYPLGLHGFARFKSYDVVDVGADFLCMRIRDDAETLAVYPFPFVLEVEYRLEAKALTMALTVENTGASTMPYSCGLHPGFRRPFAGGSLEGARVRFEKPEPPRVPVIAPGGLISERMRNAPIYGRDLPLSESLFARDALCFLEPHSHALAFEQSDDSAIELDLGDFPQFALWTRPDAPFLCLEAWAGHSDPEGFDGDVFDKPGMRKLAPGARARHAAVYRFRPAGSPAKI